MISIYISNISFSEKEGVSWESLYETKLNKNFDWHKAFRKVLATDDNDALDKVEHS